VSVVLRKIAADKATSNAGRVTGALAGAGIGGLGGYHIGRLMSANKAAQALVAATGALAGGYGGYKLGEDIDTFKDPSGRSWADAHKRELWQAAGGLGGAGVGLLGAYAAGKGDDPLANLASAVLVGGLGAVGADALYGSLYDQKKLDEEARDRDVESKPGLKAATEERKAKEKAEAEKSLIEQYPGTTAAVGGGVALYGAGATVKNTSDAVANIKAGREADKALRSLEASYGDKLGDTDKLALRTGIRRTILNNHRSTPWYKNWFNFSKGMPEVRRDVVRAIEQRVAAGEAPAKAVEALIGRGAEAAPATLMELLGRLGGKRLPDIRARIK